MASGLNAEMHDWGACKLGLGVALEPLHQGAHRLNLVRRRMGDQPRPGLLQGRSAMAWPPARGWPAMAKALYKGATGCACGHGRLQHDVLRGGRLQGGQWRGRRGSAHPRPGRKGRLPATRPQGQRSPTASPQRGNAHLRPARRGVVPTACVGATTTTTSQRGKRRT
ncbi:hypothetical protein B296_00020980 [Ensete ventricosum]|uniref:Uncharacterized protein n=1 Tax=Ensete ventricosum TaxID=4639 RepID=A0A426XQF5_ENSVE|nr:hypothetical protein B296_00020980 [Ensete ventricosum]